MNNLYADQKTPKAIKIFLSLVLLTLLFNPNQLNAQCDCAAPDYASINVAGWVPGQSANITTCQFMEERSTILNTVAGGVYLISSCGAGFDTQLDIYTTGCTFVAYNDDNGPQCGGLEASVQFTSPGGNLYSVLNEYNCAANASCVTVSIRLVSLPAPPPLPTCFNPVNEGGTITPIADAGYLGVNVGPGTYVTANVHNGGFYTFSHCGSSAGWGNSQISGYGGGSALLFYNDDNGPICNPSLWASAQYASNSTGSITVHTNRFDCLGYNGAGAGNSALLQYRCDGPGNPAVFGNNTWNLYAFNDGDAAGNSGSWSTAYSGYMILGSALSFNTQTYWTTNGSPSDNSLFLGCTVLPDNHSWTAKRQGFPCGVYQIDVNDHDDRFDLFVDGVLVAQHIGCCDTHIGAWTGTLGPSNTVEFRVSEGGGGSSGAITLNLVTPVLDGGTIGTSQTICSGGDLGAFSSLTAASGGAGGYSYNWYYEDNCAPPAVFAGSGLTYDPPALTNTRCYYRIATDVCGVDDPTNAATITVAADPTVSASGATTICVGGNATLTATPSGGTGCSAVTWESSVNGISGWTATGLSGNSVSVSPASSLYYRAVYACGATGCNPNPAISATQLVTVNPVATANAGTAQTVCQGGTITLAGSVGGGATSGTWSAPSGTFSNANALNSTYTPAIASGPVTLTLTTDDPAGPCPAVSSNVVITVNTAATANAGFPQTICEGGTVSLAGSIGGSATSATWSAPSGSFSNANSLLSTYTPSITSGSVTLTLTTNDPDGAGPCSGGVSTVVITVDQAATANAGVAQTVCGGGTITLAGIIGGSATSSTWSSGTGSFSNVNSLTSTYTPSIASGTVTLTLTTNDPDGAGPCSAATSQVVITVNAAATANAGFPQTICEGGTVNLAGSIGGSATSSTWSAPSGSFSNVNSLLSTYTPSITSGNVTLTLTTNDPDGAGPCTGAVSTVVITVDQAATANAGTPQTVCGGSSITLAGTIGGSATTSIWSAGTGSFSDATSLTSTYTPSIASGTVTLTLTTNDPDGAGPCSVATSTVVITVNSAATANAGVPQTICEGGTVVLSGGIGGSATSSTWSAPSGVFSDVNSLGATYTPSITSGTVTLTLTTNDPDGAGPCSPAVSTVVITVNPAATANAGLPQSVCQSGTITLAGTIGGSATSSTWSASTGTFSDVTSLTSTYSPTIVSGNVTLTLTTNDPDGVGPCLAATSNVVITVNPLPVISNVSVSNVLCNGGNTGSIVLTASSGTPAFNYSIDNGGTYQTLNTFTGLTAGVYFPLVTDALNCSSVPSNGVQVTEPTVLDHTTVSQNASCDNVFDGSIVVNTTGGTIPYSYSLNNGPSQLGNTFSGLLAGNYVVQVVDFNGCVDTSHVTIDTAYGVYASVVSQTNVSCFGGVDGTVTVQLAGGVPPYAYSINGVQFVSSPTFTGLASGNYVVTLRDSKGCTDFASVTISQPNLLQAFVDSVHNILCNGGNTGAIYITVTGGNGVYNFLWSNSAVTEDITGITAGTYNVAITDSKGCSASTGATISQPLPLFVTVASFHNLSCNNDNSGSVDITVSGGVPPYTFGWSNSATTEDIFGLSGGTYDVTVTDANGCSQTATQTLTEPAALSSTISPTNVSCHGASDGAVDLTVSGGTIPYNFIWSNGATSEDLSNIAGGTYTVVIHDANGCSISNSVTITEATALTLSTVVTNVLCNGSLTGAIDLTVSGGALTYTFVWSNGAVIEDISGLGAGTYSVVVTDIVGCSASISATITQPVPLFVNIASFHNLSCNNDNSGSVDISVTGGVAPYSFVWSNSATSEDIFGLGGGSYTVVVTDFNGCTQTASQTLTEPTALSSTISPTNVSCHGAADGAIDLSVSGGTIPYNFIWSNGATSEDLANIAGGTYTVVIHDANGCSITNSVTITEAPALVLSTVVTDILCNGSLTGAIDLTVTGGAPTYTFVWSNGALIEDISGVAAGTYSVVVTDNVGCSASTSATISEPAALTIVLAGHADVSCNGGNNGSIDINLFGGIPLYTYSWSSTATNEDLNSVTAGTYSVTVNDANSCTATFSTTISEPFAITSTITKTDVTCPGASNGSADLTVSGGVSPYTYLWSNGTTTEDLTGVTGGTYTVIITDFNGCTSANSIVINEGFPITVTGTVTDVLCHGDLTGSIITTVTGGISPYSYIWSNSAIIPNLTGIGAGTYSVTVADANSCSATASFVVTQPAGLVVSATTVDVGCAGGSNGSIDITVYGGVFTYTYLWSNSIVTEDLHNISGGSYTVTITDANSCTLTATYTIAEPSAITSSVAHTDVSCHGADDATASITVNGGTAPYTFFWSNFLASQNVTGLHGGLYYVVITDANGCERRDSVMIIEPTALALTAVVTDVSCYNGTNGAIDLTVTGGTPNYTYLWNGLANNATTQDVSGLVGGLYSVTVTDAHTCTATISAVISTPSQLVVNSVVHNPSCYTFTDGHIDLIPSGGSPTYSFNWSNSAITEDLDSIGAGTYTVTITDQKSCTASASILVTEPQPLVTDGHTKDVSCAGNGDGFIDHAVQGGTLPYTFAWDSNLGSHEDQYDLNGGVYTVTTSDANGCFVVAGYIVHEPDTLVATITDVIYVKCFGGSDGGVSVIPSGGKSPYFYLWNNFSTDSVLRNITAGRYVIQLTDSNGCLTYDSVMITQPTDIVVAGAVTNVICYGASTGGVTLNVSGGVPNYTFAWSNGTPAQDLTAAAAGTYTVTTTDANLCFKTNTFVLTQGPQIIPSLGALDPICHGGSTGSITAIVSGGVQPYAYAWSNTKTSVAIGGLQAGDYALTVSDAATCSASSSVTLTDPAAIVLSTNATGSRCFNTSSGVVTTSITGGTPPYTFLLNGAAQDSGTFNGLAPGSYLELVTDVNGCQGTANFVVNSAAQISVDLVSDQQVILTGMEVQLTATATTDTNSSVLHYFWSPDSAGFDFRNCVDETNCNNPFAAPRTTTTFTVTAMSSDSCYVSDTVTVQVLNQPSAFIPSAFTPNGDGLNDRFEFDILGATNIDVAIFDRWGSKVYVNASQENKMTGSNGWDGKVNGKPAAFDTYVYQMKVTYWDGVTKDFTGTVTLMK